MRRSFRRKTNPAGAILLAVLLAAESLLTGCGATSGADGKETSGITIVEVEEGDAAAMELVRQAGAELEGNSDPALQTGQAPAGENTGENAGETTGNTIPEETPFPEEEQGLADPSVDLDLTVMSATLVYAQVFNMVCDPASFQGQKIKMDGTLAIFYDEELDTNYYACIIQDATACCAQGIEFVPLADYVYPDDFPEDGAYVVVTGTMDLLEVEGEDYPLLVNASFSAMKNPS
ncbi:MAG: hypothetical protein K6A92_02055 [Lachnospiraceae bacterium]|nr:hypothetical protein [Lachnospiraceae bacterium]